MRWNFYTTDGSSISESPDNTGPMPVRFLHGRIQDARFSITCKTNDIAMSSQHLGQPKFLVIGVVNNGVIRRESHLGMEIESCVVEKEVLLDLASSISDHESRVAGHSSKKGLSGWFSCFTFPIKPPAPPLLLNEWRSSCESEAMVTWPSSCGGSRLE